MNLSAYSIETVRAAPCFWPAFRAYLPLVLVLDDFRVTAPRVSARRRRSPSHEYVLYHR
jgi:hypothetical protein